MVGVRGRPLEIWAWLSNPKTPTLQPHPLGLGSPSVVPYNLHPPLDNRRKRGSKVMWAKGSGGKSITAETVTQGYLSCYVQAITAHKTDLGSHTNFLSP